MKKHLIIIGAGLCGLSSAYLLQDHFDITIVEARNRIGGRIFGIEGHDLGPSWIWPHHHHILALIQSLQIQIFPQYENGKSLYEHTKGIEHFIQPRDERYRIRGGVSKLITSLYNRVDATVILNQPVETITFQDKRLRVHTCSHVIDADYIISTLPPRLMLQDITFSPALAQNIQTHLSSLSTWMGHSAKCVITFEKNFWRESGLSGFAFSHLGPLIEMHDASTDQSSALFGFCHATNTPSFAGDLQKQLIRLLGKDIQYPIDIHTIDWKKQRFTSTTKDHIATSAHSDYGYDFSIYDGRMLFSGSESSHIAGGYMEGALYAALSAAKKVQNSTI